MSVVVAAAGSELDPVTRAWVAEATAYSRSAGGDGEGVRVGEHGGLGHALLRTEPRQIAQPITLDGRLWLSADVRLDDRAGLITALRGRGQEAHAAADDAELLLRAHAAWGDRFLDHIAGDFAFALWDANLRRLVCARDQIGVVPLFYTALDRTVLVSTSLEALLLHPAVGDGLDEDWIADYLLAGRADDFAATAFASIRRLPPAHVLTWREGEHRVRRYWQQPEFERVLHLRRPADYVDQFRHLLELAVADRVGSGPLSVQLSGGMDSTAVAAFAHRLRASPPGGAGAMRGVTAILGGSSGDQEGDYAALVAKQLGIELDVIDESRLPATDPLAPPGLLTPEPTPYLWTSVQYQVATVAAQHARVCLSGLGADPLLSSAPWYLLEWLAHGHPLRVAVTLADYVRLFHDRPHPHLRKSARYAMQTRQLSRPPSLDWLNADFSTRTHAHARAASVTKTPAWSWDSRGLSRDPIWSTWFTYAHPSYMNLALRVRHPFADLRLLDFISRVGPDPWLINKRILREATAGLLPRVVRQRPKTNLVDVPRGGTGVDDRRAIAEFVRTAPDVDRFLDLGRLTSVLLEPTLPRSQETSLSVSLGLVYWLTHWQRPRAIPPAGGTTFRKEGTS